MSQSTQEQPEAAAVAHLPKLELGEDPASLIADVRTIPLAGLMGFLHTGALSGLLVFKSTSKEKLEKSVFLWKGEVVFAASTLAADRLGESLVRARMLTLDQFKMASAQYKPGVRFGKTLVELGFLTPRELWRGVKIQVEEIVRSLFFFTEGRIRFFEGEYSPDNVVRLALPTNRLIAEGLARREELLAFLESLRTSNARIRVVKEIHEKVSPQDRAFLEALHEAPSFSDLCMAKGWDLLSTAGRVQLLEKIGAVVVSRESTPQEVLVSEGGHPATDDDTVRESVIRLAKLLAELITPIVAIEGMNGIRERFEGVLHETARHYPALLEGITLEPTAVLDPGPLIERALALEGDREETVSIVLGELVAYLEFEIKNHPAISDPESILEGIHEDRARMTLSVVERG